MHHSFHLSKTSFIVPPGGELLQPTSLSSCKARWRWPTYVLLIHRWAPGWAFGTATGIMRCFFSKVYSVPELSPGANQVQLKHPPLPKGAPGWGQGRDRRVVQERRDEVNGDRQGYTRVMLTTRAKVPSSRERSKGWMILHISCRALGGGSSWIGSGASRVSKLGGRHCGGSNRG